MGYIQWSSHIYQSITPLGQQQPACLILVESLCLLLVLHSLLCTASGSLQWSSTPPPIFVFLETIVFPSHYKTLRGTDCWTPHPDENIKAARATPPPLIDHCATFISGEHLGFAKPWHALPYLPCKF